MKHIITNFKPLDGHHCISTAYRQVFHHRGLNLSEEMIFGLSSALNFFYFDFKVMPFPMIGGRNKIGEFEENLEKHSGIIIKIQKTSSEKKAREELYKLIEQNIPVAIYVDMAYLGYLRLPEGAHFGGHAIVVFGIDEGQGIAYVSDRDSKSKKITLSKEEKPSDFHTIRLSDLENARSSKYKPFPAENKWVAFDFSNIRKLDKNVIYSAIRKNAEQFLAPPIKNLGIKGIMHFLKSIKSWSIFDDNKLNQTAFNAFIMINQIGGTGGGCFRKMFGNFLIESSKIIQVKQLKSIGDEYLKLRLLWDGIGDKFLKIANTLNREIILDIEKRLHIVYEMELSLMQQLESLTKN